MSPLEAVWDEIAKLREIVASLGPAEVDGDQQQTAYALGSPESLAENLARFRAVRDEYESRRGREATPLERLRDQVELLEARAAADATTTRNLALIRGGRDA